MYIKLRKIMSVLTVIPHTPLLQHCTFGVVLLPGHEKVFAHSFLTFKPMSH